MNTRATIASVAVAGLFLGCGDPIKDAQKIEELRVLGARSEVEGDASRATPRPGESASVTWLVADPSGAVPETVWSLAVCVAVETNYGVPLCRDTPIAVAEREELDVGTPRIDFTVPDAQTLGDAESLAVLGVICDGGSAGGDAFGEAGCGSGQVTQRVSLEVFLASDEADDNNNPDLDGTEIFLDDEPWQEASNCQAAEALTLPADGASHTLRLELTEDAREQQTRVLDDVSVETLQISHFATAGSLERRFSNVAPDTRDFTQVLGWSAPKEVGEVGQASFFFVVRDQRGGLSWLTRTLCLEP